MIDKLPNKIKYNGDYYKLITIDYDYGGVEMFYLSETNNLKINHVKLVLKEMKYPFWRTVIASGYEPSKRKATEILLRKLNLTNLNDITLYYDDDTQITK